jgi:hypothetical protein
MFGLAVINVPPDADMSLAPTVDTGRDGWWTNVTDA